MVHTGAIPMVVGGRTIILSLHLISTGECLFLEPRPHAKRVDTDAK
jgi:hypothetical protein